MMDDNKKNMDVWEALRTRRSVREYADVPLDFDVVVNILEAGHQAPCAGGLQAWRFILVTDKNKVRSLKTICMEQECFDTAGAAIIVCALPDKVEKWYGTRGKELYAIQDCAAATENMLLAAHASGLGAVWVGAFDDSALRAAFSIPGDALPLTIICLGHSLRSPEPKSSEPIANVVFFNKYGAKIRNMNMVLRDYSLEIQARTQPVAKAAGKEAKGLAHKVKGSLKKAADRAFPQKRK